MGIIDSVHPEVMAGYPPMESGRRWRAGYEAFQDFGGSPTEFGMWVQDMRAGDAAGGDGTLPPEAFRDDLTCPPRAKSGRTAPASSAQLELWKLEEEEAARVAAVVVTDPGKVKAAWADQSRRHQQELNLRQDAMAKESCEMQARHATEHRKMNERFAKEDHAAKHRRKAEVQALGRTLLHGDVSMEFDSASSSSAPPTPSPFKLPRNNGAGAAK